MPDEYMPEEDVFSLSAMSDEHGFVVLPFRRIEEEGVSVDWDDEVEVLGGMNLCFAEHRYEPKTWHHIKVKCDDWSKVYLAAVEANVMDLDNLPFQNSIAKARNCKWRFESPLPKLAGVALHDWKDTEHDIEGHSICRRMDVCLIDGSLECCMSFFKQIEEIPGNFFSRNIVKSFRQAFYGCTIECQIPRDLFAEQKEVINYEACFEHATFAVQDSVPGCLFDDSRKAVTFANIFKNSNLKKIPESLFSGCAGALSFKGCFSRTEIESVSSCRLFEDSIKAHDFSFCFANCKKLERVGNNVFSGTAAEDYSYCFLGCTALESINNPFELEKAKNFYACFQNCTSLISVSGLTFHNARNAKEFGSCFEGCKNLMAIPDDFFHNCVSAENFDSVFRECYSIKCIPNGLFSKCSKAETFADAFKQCISLMYIGDDVFRNCSSVDNFDSTFACCTSLAAVPVNTFAWAKSVESMNRCFDGCISLVDSLLLYIPSKYIENARNFVPKNASFSDKGTVVLVPCHSRTEDAFRKESFDNSYLKVSCTEID